MPKISLRGRFAKILQMEAQLACHVTDLDSCLMLFSKMGFLELAYDLAKDMRIPRRLNNDNKPARKHFYYQFMSRHP